MATIDKDSTSKGLRATADSPPVIMHYPEDQIDFGYEIVRSGLVGQGQSRGPAGLSLAARVYE